MSAASPAPILLNLSRPAELGGLDVACQRAEEAREALRSGDKDALKKVSRAVESEERALQLMDEEMQAHPSEELRRAWLTLSKRVHLGLVLAEERTVTLQVRLRATRRPEELAQAREALQHFAALAGGRLAGCPPEWERKGPAGLYPEVNDFVRAGESEEPSASLSEPLPETVLEQPLRRPLPFTTELSSPCPTGTEAVGRMRGQWERVAESLHQAGAQEFRYLTSGEEAAVFSLGSGQLAKVFYAQRQHERVRPEFLVPTRAEIALESSGEPAMRLHVVERLRTEGITPRHLEEVDWQATAEGYELWDRKRENVGIDAQGRARWIDENGYGQRLPLSLEAPALPGQRAAHYLATDAGWQPAEIEGQMREAYGVRSEEYLDSWKQRPTARNLTRSIGRRDGEALLEEVMRETGTLVAWSEVHSRLAPRLAEVERGLAETGKRGGDTLVSSGYLEGVREGVAQAFLARSTPYQVAEFQRQGRELRTLPLEELARSMEGLEREKAYADFAISPVSEARKAILEDEAREALSGRLLQETAEYLAQGGREGESESYALWSAMENLRGERAGRALLESYGLRPLSREELAREMESLRQEAEPVSLTLQRIAEGLRTREGKTATQAHPAPNIPEPVAPRPSLRR